MFLPLCVRQLMELFGEYFVTYVARRLDDHDALLSVLGRHLRDFLNGLDNLHESPSLSCSCSFNPAKSLAEQK